MPDHIEGFRKTLESVRSAADRAELIEFVDDLLNRWEREHHETTRRLTRLTASLQALDARLLKVENSRIFRLLQHSGRVLQGWQSRAIRYLHPAGMETDQRRIYQLWLEQQEASYPSKQWFSEALAKFTYRPRLGIFLHLQKPRQEALLATIEAIKQQVYPHWELSVSSEASPEPWVVDYFRAFCEADPRVRFLGGQSPACHTAALNHAVSESRCDYVVLPDQHDRFSPDAFFHIAEALQQQRSDLLYANEDELTPDGARQHPVFRPSWSPELLTCPIYFGRLVVASRHAFRELGGLRSEAGHADLFDFTLRLTERFASFRHIPRVLYSLAPTPPHPQDEKIVLEQAIERRNWDATVEKSKSGSLLIRRKVSGAPRASIVICSRTPRLLRRCLHGIDHRTSYHPREIVVVQHKTRNDEEMDRVLAKTRCVRVGYTGQFHFSLMNNRGAGAAKGEILVFLNDDVEPLSRDWLDSLIAQVQRPEIGVAGALLRYPSGAIQHAGIALGMMDGAGHPHRATFGEGFWPWSLLTRNVTAVTGACLAIRRSVFEELNGFDLNFPVNYNDVDLCLRARQAGYEVILETSAVLRHLESKTRVRGVLWQERELFHQHWGHLLDRNDPYYSPHLTRTREDCTLA